MKKVQQGFTLIELMIVIAIIGILAAVALPAYQDYTTRAKVSEGITLASSAKTAVSEHVMSRNDYPADNTSAGYSSPDTNFVSRIGIVDGLITIEYKTDAGVDSTANQLELSPSTASGSVTWNCRPAASNPILEKYLPANCRG